MTTRASDIASRGSPGNPRASLAAATLALPLVVAAGCGHAPPGESPPPSATSGAPSRAAPLAATETEEARHASLEQPSDAGTTTRPDAPEAEAHFPEPITEAERARVRAVLGLPGSHSTSIGLPNDGRLEGGVALPPRGEGFRGNPRRRQEARYATVETVAALIRAARRVADTLPGSEVTINDLSLRDGGPIAHHGSHRAGRDVDVLFYIEDMESRPLPGVGAFLDPRGHGVDFRNLGDPSDDVDLRIDLPRTWLFVRSLIEDEHSALQRIFVAEHLRTLLLEEARRREAPEETIERFEALTCQPRAPHDDHFHFRFFCTPEDLEEGCRDGAPIYPWHRRALIRAGTRPRIDRPRPDRPRAPTTSAAEARRDAPPMHPRVEEWLDRREAWLDEPHPGRPYCR